MNELLLSTLTACLDRQLQEEPGHRFRILEIGAAAFRPAVESYPVDEYHSQPAAENHYDVVIAAGVSTAARGVREAVRDAKAALKNGGVLLIDDGALSPDTWRAVLETEGFESIAFPAADVIVAVSDGWTRQRMVTAKPAAAVPQVAQTGHVRDVIISMLVEALRIDAGAIRDDAPLAGYGVDSIVGVNLVRRISEALQIELEPATLFEYSTVEELTKFISGNFTAHLPKAAEKPAEVEAPRMTTRFTDVIREEIEVEESPREPIAIIGMSGRFADSDSLDAFWRHLAQGDHLVSQVSRWRPEESVMAATGDPYCSYGSFIDGIDLFDPGFFGISELEARYMDPQQRLFLEESWRALEDAGYASKSVNEKQCGVYVGCGSSKYDRLRPREVPPPQAFWGNSSAVTPARIAYSLNLQGPAIAVDTACSSSLVAIHLACQGLWSRETEMALAGGVFLHATPGFFQVANRAGMLSPEGKCYSFDARANGFVPGEGAGVVVLKRLRDAIAGGDHIHGVIAGSGINQDGRSNGLTAPNGRAQERLERAVYERFGIDPATIQVVEAHGAGTLLGDSVEHAALTRAFRVHTDKQRFCALGTVKTNIGHTSAASGVAGVFKLLLGMKHRQIPPSLHFETGNPAIDFDSGPFYVNTQLRDWSVDADEVRRAAVSSFGFGGTNAHLVLDEAPLIVRRAEQAQAQLIVVSARSGEQLKQLVRNLLAHLEQTPASSMTDLGFTLSVGRTHFNHRLACIARNAGELTAQVAQWLESGSAPNVYAAEIQEGRVREKVSLKKFGDFCIETCRTTSDEEKHLESLAAVADLYIQGYALDYGALFPNDARRIPLPAYPFARERYWLDDVAPAAVTVSRERASGNDLQPAGDSLENELSALVREIAGVSHVSTDKVLQDVGLDSIGLTKFAKAINDRFQLDITPVIFFDYPTVHEIANHLSDKYGAGLKRAPGVASAPTPTPAPVRVVASAREPIAVVGMAGVMPQADDLDELWANLTSSKDAITVIPRDRWNWEETTGDPLKEENKSNSKWGGFLREVDKFDARFFSISPREAQMMDPQQRMFLETAWKAIEDAGHKASDLSGTRTGVFAAAGNNDYKEVLRTIAGGLDGYSASGNTNSVLANRVSFLLNLRGPSESIDTACSSALVALHRAVDSIHSGECDMAIVGGVNAIVSPEPYIAFGKAGLLSPDGRCKTFDKKANGFVRAEGAGVIFVKPLSAAEADGNHIYAVIRSTAINHGGRVPTLGAPSGSGQTALLIDAYEKAGIDPSTVGYIECHGTGTALGDPIETEALSAAFAELYKRHGKAPAETPHCGLGSVKTNLGHLENAAGIAGLLKALLVLQHKQIPANLHFSEQNPYVRLDGTPFYIVDKLTPFEAPASAVPRRAGVSSFGFGGTNSHVVLEEYIPRKAAECGVSGPQVIVLSAKNEDRLRAYARSMISFLDKNTVDLRDFAYTLQAGRDEMPERLAFVAANADDVRRTLEAFVEGHAANVFRGNTRTAAVREGEPAEAWVSGAKIDWASLHEGASPKRISLPSYPFARDRHWAAAANKPSAPKAKPAALHPMVHRNASTATEQKFASRFTGEEFYFDDHRVETQKVLPAVGYLELVRAAGELGGIPQVRTIRNVTWQTPLAVGANGEEVEVLLTPDHKDVKFSVRTVGKGQHCSGKLSSSAPAEAPGVVDVAAIRARCPRRVLTGPELYGPVLAGSGLELRRSFQVVREIYASDDEALSIIQLPEHLRADADRFFLHPALMDGAIQTFVGLVKKNPNEPLPLALPFSMGEVQLFQALKNIHYAHVQLSSGQKLTVQMLDERGNVLVRIKDFVLRPAHKPAAKQSALKTFAPVWNPLRIHAVPPPSDLLLLSGDAEWVRQSMPDVRVSGALSDSLEQLLWIAPPATDDGLIEQQGTGVIALYRLIKELLEAGYATKPLALTIVTQSTQRVRADDAIQPAHAGIAGLIGSVAKEYPRWELRLVDVESFESVTAAECLSLPFDKQGNVYARRGGEWFTQSLARVETLPAVKPLYRRNGVYVVIGGAGGVGEVWSRFMIERFDAKIVWIGRRPVNADIESRIKRLGDVLYIAADATDADALARARETVLQRFGAIHGVVQSAIVLQDQSIARMDETTFRTTLAAKVDVSVNMERVFGEQPLDFMLFFSSLISFAKTPGQSNYSAACTFKDAFAQKLQQTRPYAVKIMNWGYWGSVGIVADEEHNKRMARMGAASIEPEEGMAALQTFADSDAFQVALVKMLTDDGLTESLAYYPKTTPPVLPQVHVTPPSIAALEADAPAPAMVQLVGEILASSLESAGWSVHAAPYFERWLRSSIDYVKQHAIEVRPLHELWTAWDASKASWTTSENRGAHIALLEACLRALPGIVAGRQLPTDVMFPGSSMRLVEPVYRGNLQADYFNAVLRDTLVACIEQLMKTDGNRAIRILEIGAGTGGTTAGLLPVLRNYPVEEYCYTDLSKAFLMHAEKNYRPQLPALTTAVFDVSKPLASQAIKVGHYDVVIAANVLHATPNIRETLRNAKAVLKNQGVLLLNELSTWSLLTHVTFGLLEGWWLYEDVALRMPGTPGIATEQWRAVLAGEGFESAMFTVPDAHHFGQQIIAASSDGCVRQRIVKGAAPAPVARPAAAPAPAPRQAGGDHIRRIITDALSEALKLEPGAIRNDEPFADYGVDSIIGVNLVSTINEQLQIELETTKLFEYTTVNQLAEHIAAEYRPAPASAAVQETAAEIRPKASASHVRDIITAALSEALKLEPGAIRNDEPFADYGVDSIIGVNLIATINEQLQIELETTKLFEFTTVNQLADYIQSEFTISAPAPVESEYRAPAVMESAPEVREIAPERREVGMERIAIIGISGRFAGSETLEEFWRNLVEGRDLVKTVSRWNASDCVVAGHDGRYCADGSFIESIDRFDPAFFRISAEEAVCMDPQQRLFLEESWKALEDAGYAGKSVREKQCGVYVGCLSSRYLDMLGPDRPPHALWGTAESIIPTRIAYYLDLQGPAIAVDTACSSSLVTIHLACQSLWTGETEMALAGGVFLQPTAGFYKMANGAGMLSPDGRCYSFDARANGYVPGEGVGVVVLKRLRDAIADGDHIYGVIAGTAINQDGSSNGLIAPNARAQERLERAVYDRFDINPESIQFVEAHGSGTLLGDAIELGALTRAFRAYTDRKQFCAIGTLKTNFGHTVTAAGVAGVLKVLLAMKHRQIPPSLHLQKANPGIAFDSSPFYLNGEPAPWNVEDGGPRRAAVSSFGFNGTNAHLVIDEAPAMPRASIEAPGYLLALSARTQEQLRQRAADLVGRLKSEPGLSMNDVSFTLLTGRTHLAQRMACVVRDRDEAMRMLESGQFLAGEVRDAREHASLARLGNRAIRECRNAPGAEYLENLAAIADLYVQGYALEFEALFPAGSRRVSLPVYPFARERYWVDVSCAPTPRADEPSPFRAAQWVFTREPNGAAASMASGAKMSLFLRQEIAQQLLKPIEDVPTDLSFFDLGLTSLGMANLVKNTCSLLDEELQPSVLFEHRDIDSLASYLAMTWPARIDSVSAVRVSDKSFDEILDNVSWQDAAVHDGYEKVTI